MPMLNWTNHGGIVVDLPDVSALKMKFHIWRGVVPIMAIATSGKLA